MPATAAPPLPVDVVMRADFAKVGGGDVLQMDQYLRHIGGEVDARYVAYSAAMDLRPGAIRHILNIDRPFDFLDAFAQCGDRTIVSPIHHSLVRMRLMREAIGRDSKLSFLPESVRERLAFLWRAHRAGGVRSAIVGAAHTLPTLAAGGSGWRAVGRALDRAAAVALLAREEAKDLRDDAGWGGRNGVLIPNGIPEREAIATTPWRDRPRGIVVVGRIEPRKRQLEIARAAADQNVPVGFVGPIVGDDGYRQAFRELAQATPCLDWMGPMPPDRTVATIAESRVLLNASWVEVQSLIDIEAATVGTAIVGAPTGSSSEWLGSLVHRMGDDDVPAMVRAAATLAAGATPPPPAGYRHTWQDSAQTLLALYHRVAAAG